MGGAILAVVLLVLTSAALTLWLDLLNQRTRHACQAVERALIIRTTVPQAVREVARELVTVEAEPRPAGAAVGAPAPHDGPARAVDVREVPGPVQPRQGASPAARRPSGGLDPAGRPQVWRQRSRGAGSSDPPDDRDNTPSASKMGVDRFLRKE
jgi:hypothetical protein